ncbi:hypothetical protein NIES4073_02290 (plasmid) [Kalymmatonema gypsitolerans NIES-4073]|nr:hypothetical protein NIES4073_02290 [Scytonema sp. NIES-4073]
MPNLALVEKPTTRAVDALIETFVCDLQKDDIIWRDNQYWKVQMTRSYPWSWVGHHRSVIYGTQYEIYLLPLSFQYKPYQWGDRSKADWNKFWFHTDNERHRLSAATICVKVGSLFKMLVLPF